jgi:succinate dehydrogenase / fumarate reductase cytochrome b subunit
MSEERKRLKRYRSGFWSGSLNPAGFNVERWAYTLHRITGFILIAYLIAHLLETRNIAISPDMWEAARMQLIQLFGPMGEKLGLWVVAGAAFYHGGNGIRLIIAEMFALLIGRPKRPELDHKTVEYIPFSLTGGQRALLWLVTVVALILWAIAAAYVFTNWVI